MILVWQSYGIINLYSLKRTPDGIEALKKLIIEEVRSWSISTKELESLDSFTKIRDWVANNTVDTDCFERFEFSSLIDLE